MVNLLKKTIKSVITAFLSTAMLLCSCITASATTYSAPNIYSFSNTYVAAGYTKTTSVEFELYAGDRVSFSFSYSPAGSVDFGLVSSGGTFYRVSCSSGLCISNYTILNSGTYRFRVRNNSSSAIQFFGSVTVGWNYMFRSPNMAVNISDNYHPTANPSHKGVDITNRTATSPSNIFGCPVYSTGKGEVILARHYDKAGYTVAVKMDNGLTVRYLHLRNDLAVHLGDSVDISSLIGRVSGTGVTQSDNDYGKHLHYDINNAGTYNGSMMNATNTINPELFFRHISFTYYP